MGNASPDGAVDVLPVMKEFLIAKTGLLGDAINQFDHLPRAAIDSIVRQPPRVLELLAHPGGARRGGPRQTPRASLLDVTWLRDSKVTSVSLTTLLIPDIKLKRSPVIGLAVGLPGMQQAKLGGAERVFGRHAMRQFSVRNQHQRSEEHTSELQSLR